MPVRLRKEWISLFALAAIAVGAIAYYLYRPDGLRVAFPRDGDDARIVTAFADVLREQRKGIRLILTPVDDYAAASAALEQGRAQLAVVRPDVAMPVNGLTVAILREEAVILLSPTAAKIEALEGLEGKRLGVVSRHQADPRFIASLLEFYKLAPPALTLVQLKAEEVEAALRGKQVDAVAVIAPPGDREANAVIAAVAQAAPKKEVRAIPIAESDALAERMPALSAIKIPAGGLEGRPKLPDEELSTVGVSSRLLARADLDPGMISNLTQYLFEMRPRLAAATPAANRVKPPDSTMGLTLPTHPGAIRYIEREQLTFFEQYGDYIYLLLFCGGGISSAVAWVMQRLVRRRRELVDEVLDRLTCILTEAREATSLEALNELAAEVDGLVTHALRYTRHRGTDTSTFMSPLILAIDSARAAIADRRRDLLDQAAGRARDAAERGREEAEPPGTAAEEAAASAA